MLASGFLTTSDQFAALFFLAAVASNWVLFQRITLVRLAAASLAAAGLLLCKSSGLLLAPMILLLIVVRVYRATPLSIAIGRRRDIPSRPATAAILLVIATTEVALVFMAIWASFGFRYSAFATDEANPAFEIPWVDVETGLSPLPRQLVQKTRNFRLLPEAYIYGLANCCEPRTEARFCTVI